MVCRKKCGILIVLLSWSLLAFSACESESTSPPLLPPGFSEAQVPDFPLEGFGFISQMQPLVPSSEGSVQPMGGSPVMVEGALFNSDTAVAWANLSTPALARLVASVLPVPQGVEESVLGAQVWLARGASISGLAEKKWVKVQDREPNATKLLWRLPSEPPVPPIAMGFTWVRKPLLNMLRSSGMDDGKRLAQILTSVQAEYVVGAVYGNSPLSLSVPSVFSMNAIPEATEMQAEFLFVIKSNLPFLGKGIVWEAGVRRFGFTKIQLGNDELFHEKLRGWDITVEVKDSYIYLAGAPTLQASVALLSSAIHKQ